MLEEPTIKDNAESDIEEETMVVKELYKVENNEIVVNNSIRWLKKGRVRPIDESVFCYIHDGHVTWSAGGVNQHSHTSRKIDYTRQHNEVSIPKIFIRVFKAKSDIRIRTDAKIWNNTPNTLRMVGKNMLRGYDLSANKLGLIYKFYVEIVPCVMNWDRIVTKSHKTYFKRLKMPMSIEVYIQLIVIKKIVEEIFFDRPRVSESEPNGK
ncbi:hypothetical protein CWI38_0183p0030 [Hamiltosporidium tvaerminnensis]|uniref:Uncharacterized protein n=1 Tax=Hamiltosporidium tvaerminnensis TaxID=1176355 RepID=A0A4Q9M1M3_9MICR|nr:hypothetical protein CWI38_0183p0030 [Hamiltosporidium tvaerminnensis]